MSEYIDRSLTCPRCNLKSCDEIAEDYYLTFLNRLDAMFKWKGLPDTIPEEILERYLKTIGWCGIGQVNDKLYCFFGGLGGPPSEYYRPTKIILANPVLGSREFTIGKDVVWAKNDSLYRGVSSLLARYANLLATNDVSIHVAQINSRIPFVFTGDTQSDVDSANKFIQKIEKGELSAVLSSSFNKGVIPTSLTTGSGDYLKALIELHQYLKSQCWLDFGINSNYNMKRERQNTAEVEANAPALLPLVDEMLKFRKKICEDVKEMFPGQDWDVELSSAWKLENETQTGNVELLVKESTGVDEEQEDNSDEVQ